MSLLIAMPSAAYIFFGGILMLVGGLLELLLANTFSAVVFMSFGMSILPPVYWLCGVANLNDSLKAVST